MVQCSDVACEMWSTASVASVYSVENHVPRPYSTPNPPAFTALKLAGKAARYSVASSIPIPMHLCMSCLEGS